MDSVDIKKIEADIKEIQESFVKAKNHNGSEDVVDELTRGLGETVGNMVYVANGPNDFEVDKDELQKLTAVGTVGGDRNTPTLFIENPLDEYDPIEVKIIDPTEQ